MSTDGKTKAELVEMFNRLADEQSDPSAISAMKLVFEVLCDIRDGLIKDHDQDTK